MRSGDRAPHSGERRVFDETNTSSLRNDSQFLPQRGQVNLYRFVLPLVVQIAEHRGARRLITDFQRFWELPVMRDVTPRVQNSAQRVLQPLLIVRLLANLDVRHKTKKGATPVRPPPTMRVIQPAIALLRLTLWHVAHQVGPHPLRAHLLRLDARYRLHIYRNALFYPMMRVSHR